MKRHVVSSLLALGFALSSPLPAWAVYKCESEKGVSYGDAPCPNGKLLDIDGATSSGAASAQAQLAQDKKSLKELETARRKKEAQEQKERRQGARVQATGRKSCEKLALRKKWADEDAAVATGKAVNKARLKARRADEAYQLQCGHTG